MAAMAVNTKMLNVLQKLNLQQAFPNFEREKITPDIVCRLSTHEMEILGVTRRADMMKLRTECVKYGTSAPNKINSECGPSKFDIPKSVLKNVLENGFKISDISKLLSVSESTIYRRMSRFGLSKMNFTQIDDSDLDLTLGQIMKEFPLCYETLLQQMLLLKGIRVQRWRLRECMHRLDTAGVQARRTGRLHRCVYNVMGPNHLWHKDTNHKLVRWRFVIVGGIDGFSRLITFLKCTDNNTSRTVLDCFFSGVAKYGIPDKVRSDKGLENVSVANYKLIQKGPNSMVTGKSTHNQRIERLWRDVYEGVLSYFYNLFYFMEDEGYLDPLKLTNLAALHFVFMDEINRKLQFWAEVWAGHRLRTVNSSPLSLWTSCQLQNAVGITEGEANLQDYGIEGYVDQNDIEEDERSIFGPLAHMISDQCRLDLTRQLIRSNTNFGIDFYLECLEVIERNN